MRNILLFFLCLCFASSAQAQLADRLVPHFGFMLELLTLEQDDVSNPATGAYNFYTIGIGSYYVLAQKNDRYSVGLDPNLQFGLQGFNGSLDFTVQMPVYLMGRFGAFCTPYNTQTIGFGAGVGLVNSYIGIRSLDGRNKDFDFNQFYVAPSIILEGSLNLRSGPLTGRLHLPLGKPVHDGVTILGNTGFIGPSTYTQVGLGVIYGF
ncbi:MAG: hypothetical protein AB8F95_03730 [Bacteroidia bacterium]